MAKRDSNRRRPSSGPTMDLFLLLLRGCNAKMTVRLHGPGRARRKHFFTVIEAVRFFGMANRQSWFKISALRRLVCRGWQGTIRIHKKERIDHYE